MGSICNLNGYYQIYQQYDKETEKFIKGNNDTIKKVNESFEKCRKHGSGKFKTFLDGLDILKTILKEAIK